MINLQKIESYVKESLKNDKTGHDFEHTKRVLKIAEEIAKTENCDSEILKLACLYHDIAYKDGVVKNHHLLGAKIAVEELKKINYSEDKIKKVEIAIEDHVAHMAQPIRTNEELQIESKILRDADNIDALGAIGIIRSVSFCVSKDRPYFRKKEDGFDDSLYGHLNFLVGWGDSMLTKKGKELGKQRAEVIKQFIQNMDEEL